MHKADVKSSRSTKLAELKLIAAVEPNTEIEAIDGCAEDQRRVEVVLKIKAV